MPTLKFTETIKRWSDIFDSFFNTEDSQTEQQSGVNNEVTRIGTKQLCHLFKHLAALLKSGLQIVPALTVLAEQFSDKRLGSILERISDRVTSGVRLSTALSEYPSVFSQLTVNMVSAGERDGNLENVLLRLSEIFEKKAKLADKIKTAIAYPALMLIVALSVVVFLLSFVVPSLTSIFTEMGQELPLPTVFLIAVSSFMKTYFWLVLAFLFAFILGIAGWMKTAKGKSKWDRIKLKTPLFGKLILKVEIARLTRTLGVLLTNGLPVLDALDIAKGVTQNTFIAESLESVKDSIEKGDDIASSIKKTGVFPPIVYQILSTGQAGGNIEEGLINIADIYDDEVNVSSQNLTSLLEPVILIFMGIIIGFIVLAVLLPIFEINTVI